MTAFDQIDPLKKATLSTMVAERIRELVIAGAYAAGDQLNEVELASHFGVSRGPVREGLRALVHDGLLRSEPHRGVFVPVLDADDIADIYRAREAVETAAVGGIVVEGRHVAVAAELQTIAEEMQQAFDADGWTRVLELDGSFHTTLVRGSRSRRLQRMYGTLIDETRICLRQTIPRPPAVVVGEHALLAALLKSGSVADTVVALTAHLQDSSRLVSSSQLDGGAA